MLITIAKLLPILCIIESGNNPLAVGDNGKAVGILQIHKCVVDDVNRVYGTNFTYADRTYEYASKYMATLYLAYWGRRYMILTGKEPDEEVLSKLWNGGPTGYDRDSTNKYWEKVKKELNKR